MLHQTVRRVAVSRIVFCTHAHTARNHVHAREPDLNSSYFIPHQGEAGKRTRHRPDVRGHRWGRNGGRSPDLRAHGLQRQVTGRRGTGLSPQQSGSLLVQGCLSPPLPELQEQQNTAHISPACSESRGASWLSQEGARRPGLHSTARTRGRGRRGVCGRTLPRHASGSSDNRLSDCDRTSPTSGLQNGHKPQASLFDKPTRPDVLGRSLSNWCKVWRSESRIFHPAYCVLSFDTGSGFTFASDYRERTH